MNATRARELLYNWHNGQWSPTYGAASSGLVINMEHLVDELTYCQTLASTDEDRAELVALCAWLLEGNFHYDGSYVILPWGKR
jgi:hypothetical protein